MKTDCEPYLKRPLQIHSNRRAMPALIAPACEYRTETSRQRRAKLRTITRREMRNLKQSAHRLPKLAEVKFADVVANAERQYQENLIFRNHYWGW
jgi:hypothetical protein